MKLFWQDSHVRETLRGGGVFLVIKVLGAFGAYLFAWYVSRRYGAEGNGVLAFVFTLTVLLTALYNLGLNTYIVKIIPQFQYGNDQDSIRIFYRKALTTVIIATFAGSLLCLVLSYIVSSESLSRDLLLVSLLCIPISAILFNSQTFKARKNIWGFSLLQNNTVQLLALLILLLPVWQGSSDAEPVWSCIVAAAVLAIAGQMTVGIGKPMQGKFLTPRFSVHLRESIPMLMGGLAILIFSLTDRLMLRFLETTDQLGIYDVVLKLANLILLGILSLNAIAEPKFSELFVRGDMEGLQSFVARMTWTGIVISIPVVVMLGCFPDFWLGLFGNGNEFLSGRTSLYILLSAQVVNVGCGSVLVLLYMTGHQRTVQTILIVAVLINIGLATFLIPVMGIDGAAWATAISTIIWNIWALWAVRRKLGIWMWA